MWLTVTLESDLLGPLFSFSLYLAAKGILVLKSPQSKLLTLPSQELL